MFGLTRVTIVGPSMEPALCHGEEWLATRGRVRPGRVVVFWEPGRPHLRAVKRVTKSIGDQWWVEGDNPAASRDSRHYGPIPRSAITGVLRRRLR